MSVSLLEKLDVNKIGGIFSKISGKWVKLARGIAIFIIAILILGYTTSYILETKIDMRFGLAGFESITPKAPSFETIMFSRTMQAFMVLFIVAMIASLMAFLRGYDWKLISLLTLVFHSFLVVVLFTALQVPFMIQVPRTTFAIVDANMQNVTFYNATMTGLTSEGTIEIHSDVVKATYVKAFRVYPNMSIPDWGVLTDEEAKKAMENTITYMNMSDVKWLSKGVENHVDRLDLSSGNWSRVEYVNLLERSPIRITPTIAFEEVMLSVFSVLSTIGIAIYNAIGFKKLYETSTKYAVATGAIIFVVLFLLGIL